MRFSPKNFNPLVQEVRAHRRKVMTDDANVVPISL
jgi:hypothetical protein